MSIDELLELALGHRWIALTALIIGALVRLLKSETLLPAVPKRVRPWIAMGLGIVAGTLDMAATGAPWLPALVEGLAAALIAIAGHELGIESLRGGRELFTRRDGDEPPRGIEQATRTTGAMVLMFFAAVFAIGACTPERPACSPAALAAIEGAYLDEVIHACEGQTFDACTARPEIERRYAMRREAWARCR